MLEIDWGLSSRPSWAWLWWIATSLTAGILPWARLSLVLRLVTSRIPPPAGGNERLDERLLEAMTRERARGLDRRCPPTKARAGLRYELGGRRVLSFCSNDYLDLADSRLEQGSGAPSGAAGSRLVCGDLEAHRELEQRFAAFLGCEDAVLFPSGFQANVSVPAALLGEADVVFSDALNHASLIDGLRLAKPSPQILPHLQAPAPEQARGSWWFVESLFSMDGDGPALVSLDTHLAHGGCVYLDEAHAVGLYAEGRGRAARLSHRATVILAPLGKAFGCAGAFVGASSTVCRYLRSHARGFVFSTGVSPALLPRIAHALDCVSGEAGERRRERLWRNVELARQLLGVGPSKLPSPIIPIVVGDNERALRLSAALLERGWHVQAIRPPTVPAASSRLRVTISAGHEPEELERFASDLMRLLERQAGRRCAKREDM